MIVPRLRVNYTEVVLGSIVEPAELPELLRHVADYYEHNPDACVQLCAAPAPNCVPGHVAQPFAGNDNGRYYG